MTIEPFNYEKARKLFYAQIPVQHSPKVEEQLMLEGAYLHKDKGVICIGDIKTNRFVDYVYRDDFQYGSRFGYSFAASLDAEYIVVGEPNYLVGVAKVLDLRIPPTPGEQQSIKVGRVSLFQREIDGWKLIDTLIGKEDQPIGYRVGISLNGKRIVTCGEYDGWQKLAFVLVDVKDCVLQEPVIEVIETEENESFNIWSLDVNEDEIHIVTANREQYISLIKDDMKTYKF